MSALFYWIPWSFFPYLPSFISLSTFAALPCLPIKTFKSLSFGVPFQICISAFTSVPAQGWEDVLPLCSRQVFFLLGCRLNGEKKKYLYFLLCFSFWLLITEFAVGDGRDRRYCFGSEDLWKPVLWFLPWHEQLLLYYVYLLNSELFRYLLNRKNIV